MRFLELTGIPTWLLVDVVGVDAQQGGFSIVFWGDAFSTHHPVIPTESQAKLRPLPQPSYGLCLKPWGLPWWPCPTASLRWSPRLGGFNASCKWRGCCGISCGGIEKWHLWQVGLGDGFPNKRFTPGLGWVGWIQLGWVNPNPLRRGEPTFWWTGPPWWSVIWSPGFVTFVGPLEGWDSSPWGLCLLYVFCIRLGSRMSCHPDEFHQLAAYRGCPKSTYLGWLNWKLWRHDWTTTNHYHQLDLRAMQPMICGRVLCRKVWPYIGTWLQEVNTHAACYTFLLQGMLVWYRYFCLLKCMPVLVRLVGTGTSALYCCSTVVRLVGTCTYVFYACLVQGHVLCMLVW